MTDALNPLLDLLSTTLLTTPTIDQIPNIADLWNSSWQILLVFYVFLILFAGIMLMGYQTIQTRTSIKEIAPRIIVGFLAGGLSLWVCSTAIQLANALAQALMSGGVDPTTAGDTLKNLVVSSLLSGGFFIVLLEAFLAVLLILLLLTYIVRVALTIILIAGAPLALMFHALPQTEGIARWWWKAFGGCLAIQLGQSLTLIVAIRVFLAPGGFTLFGPTASGLINVLVTMALLYILFKIPFWILGSIRGSGGHSFVGGLARGFLAYKTFGLLRGVGGKAAGAKAGGTRAPKPPASPYARVRATASGQYQLPLPGIKRSRRPQNTTQHGASRPSPKAGAAGSGTQLAFPLDGEWPEHKPTLNRDGQYRLPLDVQRVPRPPQAPTPPPTRRPTSGQRQLTLPADGEWPENKPRLGIDGQYRLPFAVPRVPAPPRPPSTRRPTPPQGRQTRLPLDGEWPENKPTVNRDGQYQLPLGVPRARKPVPPPPHPPSPTIRPPAQPRQQPLPLDLPKLKPPRPGTRAGGKDT